MTLAETARKYLGQKEGKNNTFGNETELGKRLHEAGQKDGEAWCAYFVEACLKETAPERFDEFDKLCNASAVQTYKNCRDAAFLIGEVPNVNWLVVWQKYEKGRPQWMGHIGIVSKVNADGTFLSIEGNTNSAGSREGIEVAERSHRVAKDVNDGLRVIGFVRVV